MSEREKKVFNELLLPDSTLVVQFTNYEYMICVPKEIDIKENINNSVYGLIEEIEDEGAIGYIISRLEPKQMSDEM